MPELGEIKRGKAWHKHIWAACLKCGKERWVIYRVGTAKPVNGLCKQCAPPLNSGIIGRKGDTNPNWKGGNVILHCLNCNKNFELKREGTKTQKGNRKFCSHACSLIYHRKLGCFRKGPNGPERLLIELLENHNLPFKYVGNCEIWLGNHNPDFINVNGKKQVIEVFGSYWHPVFDVARWKEHYKQYGFDCLIVWDDELSKPDLVMAKVQKYARSKTI